VANTLREYIPSTWRKGKNTKLKNPMWGWGYLAATVEKSGIALPWRNREQAETKSLTNRKAHF
jgi:hypothetical protein